MVDRQAAPYSILLVGEHPALLRALHFRLQMSEYAVRVEKCCYCALDKIGVDGFDLVISDVGMLSEGKDVVHPMWANGRLPMPHTIFLTSDDDVHGQPREGREWIRKPFDMEMFVHTVESRLSRIHEKSYKVHA